MMASAEQKLEPVVASPFDPSADRESNGGDELSQYSSCGGESETERYCSAVSAIGTPSVAGSSFRDSDFGSLKSFKLGGENSILSDSWDEQLFSTHRESYGVSVSGSSRGDELFRDGNSGEMLKFKGKREASVSNEIYSTGNLDEDVSWCDWVQSHDEIPDERPIIRSEDQDIGYTTVCCQDVEVVFDNGEPFLSSEHSEGDDSMFGCDSDNERKTRFYCGKNAIVDELESGKEEDYFVMNSKVAFGSDDWDDFVHESSVVTMTGDEIQTRKQENHSVSPHLDCNHAVMPDGSKTVLTPGVTINGDLEEHANCSYYSKLPEISYSSLRGAVKVEELNDVESEEKKDQDTSTTDIVSICHDTALKTITRKEGTVESDPLSQLHRNGQTYFPVKVESDGDCVAPVDDLSIELPSLARTTTKDSTSSDKNVAESDQTEGHLMPTETRDMELIDVYDEIVNDMQDVLLDCGESPHSGLGYGSRIYQSTISHPSTDGGSTASTSGGDFACDRIQQFPRIDSVEVVGVRQKKGDVSFSERLVGVQKYAVYQIKVWSGDDNWEVERRYSDFCILYHRLKKLFSDNRLTLPSPWSAVERESWKLFGSTSPVVIANRSVLIQDCLQSIINFKFSGALSCFLSPSESASLSWSQLPNRHKRMENVATFGKTLSLVVNIQPVKSMKHMLDLQYYRCAGCHRNFDDETSAMRGFAKALGWGGPRYCEYSGQLFCSSCHVNDTAVVPSKVLHCWDFTLYPVSQLAKSFLGSIHDQPMLCVGAVNPFLFSKVPTLQHVANTRNRIRAMLPYVRCPFRRSIYKGLGSRSYLLDSNDFFALKDLIDLSKGVFSALAVKVESLSQKIQDHITEQCLVCYDVGVPCSARQNCMNPMALIFPFQEGDVKRCRSCELIYHKNCFRKMASCPCGATLNEMEMKQISRGHQSLSDDLKLQPGSSEPSNGILSSLFSKVIPRSQEAVTLARLS